MLRASLQNQIVGQKKKWDHQQVRNAVKEMPFHETRTLRDLSAALAIPFTSLYRMKSDRDDSVIMPCASTLKPLPEEGNLQMTRNQEEI